MPFFTIEYVRTERTRRQALIEADTQEEAIRLVEEYESDDSEASEVDSLEWSISDVACTDSQDSNTPDQQTD